MVVCVIINVMLYCGTVCKTVSNTVAVCKWKSYPVGGAVCRPIRSAILSSVCKCKSNAVGDIVCEHQRNAVFGTLCKHKSSLEKLM